MSLLRSPWRIAVAVGCAYEIVALVSDRVPTISEVVVSASEHPAGRFAAWLFVGGWSYHFLVRPQPPIIINSQESS